MQRASITIGNLPPRTLELLAAHFRAELLRFKIEGATFELARAVRTPPKEIEEPTVTIQLEGVAQFIDDASAAEAAAGRLTDALDRLQRRLAPVPPTA